MNYCNNLIDRLSDLDFDPDTIQDVELREYVRLLSNALERTIRDASRFLKRIEYLETQSRINGLSAALGRKTSDTEDRSSPSDPTSNATDPEPNSDTETEESSPESGTPSKDADSENDSSFSSDKFRKEQEALHDIKDSKPRNSPNRPPIEEVILTPRDLPDDAELAWCENHDYQDLKIVAIHKKFVRQVYYSHREDRYFKADLPEGVREHQHYGPGIETLLLQGKADYNLTEQKLLTFLTDHGVAISNATISRLSRRLADDIFFDESREIFAAGIESGTYVHLDDQSGVVQLLTSTISVTKPKKVALSN